MRLLAIDIGSSSVRTRFYDRDLRPREAGIGGIQPYAWKAEDGAMEVDADELLAHVSRAIDGAVAGMGDAVVEAVGIACFWHSLVGTDALGNALTPVYGWGDTRAREHAAGLHRVLDAESYHQRTGCFLRASYPLARLAWLRDRSPETFSAVRYWMSFAEFLEMRLFGTARVSHSMASGSGLFDLARRGWDVESLAAAGVAQEQLSEPVPFEARSGLRTPWSERWPPLADAAWYPALGDGACANLGDLAIGSTRPAVTVGTSAAARVVWKAAPGEEIPGPLWCYLLEGDYRVAGGALSNGGNGLAFLRTRLRAVDLPDLSDAVARTSPDDYEVMVIPSLIAERSMGWQDIENGSILGLEPETTSQQIAVAWLHAITGRIGELLERIEQHFGEAEMISANGGALHAVPGWVQALADATGRPVRFGSDPEATIRGVARMLADALDWQSLEDQRTDTPDRILEPRPGLREAYQRSVERQRVVASALRTTEGL